MKFTCPFVLASGSPRRSHLLQQLGVSFTVDAADVDESFEPGIAPDVVVQDLAKRKARAVAHRHPDGLLLAADTLVVLGDKILGKPVDPQDAIRMLKDLRNQTHEVFTGIALQHLTTGRLVSAAERTEVRITAMTDREITAYVASGSPMDKAGSYGIQDDRGALFVEGVVGDYYNVVGLPLHRLYETLKASFSDLLVLE